MIDFDAPLGLLNIASYIRSMQFRYGDLDVRINDLSGKELDECLIGESDIYGITTYVTSLDISGKIASICKSKNPNSIVVIGGAHPSSVPRSCDFSDIVVIGEGEIAMNKIVEWFRLNPKSTIQKIIKGEQAPINIFPAYDLIDTNSYNRRINGLKSLPYASSRGCCYNCNFCGLSGMHHLNKLRFYDPEVVSGHLRIMRDRFSVGGFTIQDDMFTLNRDRLFKLLDLIKSLSINFRCHGRAGYDTEEVYKKLAESGCVQVAWGIESGSQSMLDRMNKEVTIKENSEVIRWAKKYGITSRAFFIIGFPGETKETLQMTKNFIEESEPDQIFVSSFVPYPGTDVYENPKKYGIIKLDKDFSQYYQVNKSGFGGLIIDTEWLSREELRELEVDFRMWVKDSFKWKGEFQEYEEKIYKKNKNTY